ncbi:pantoate--beta-alanine ligase [Rhodococcus triatomae]|uniref:Pantothenate synthetase n=1 Tax=Rhodococcus triatomae TaxID=300028 RepID=A0A1G8RY28_9NOCA|nr:pantoate--beta-alanine ligase [Rhodococcus triatomae]QNG17368.1 pantoate--beta-alanine ligase [Rhodococcus triatomae]QNG22965.1 pantoate--beta-alanine ligase [Rhodococcus triatomae]SDJ21859.1 pantoate--beta-alanine ligase [Rhodococcus triatomae]
MTSAVQGGYARGELTVHHDPAVLTRVSRALRGVGRQVALVPTMGALHAGHLELVRVAKLTGAVVIVSIFVNPLQFGEGEDLDAYPRTLDADLQLLRDAGVELAFVPTATAMYPNGPRTTIVPGPLGAELEGGSRPTHFAGMLTVVAKLLQIAAPHVAYFGEKDYQQLTLIRQMVTDLDFDVRIVGVPTVREHDGLALSSRNRYLDDEERTAATALSAALIAGAHAGAGGADAIVATAREVLAAFPQIEVDYLEVRAPDLTEPPERGDGRLLVAARIGKTRLIDNVGVAVGTGFLERDSGTGSPGEDDLLAH